MQSWQGWDLLMLQIWNVSNAHEPNIYVVKSENIQVGAEESRLWKWT